MAGALEDQIPISRRNPSLVNESPKKTLHRCRRQPVGPGMWDQSLALWLQSCLFRMSSMQRLKVRGRLPAAARLGKQRRSPVSQRQTSALQQDKNTRRTSPAPASLSFAKRASLTRSWQVRTCTQNSRNAAKHPQMLLMHPPSLNSWASSCRVSLRLLIYSESIHHDDSEGRLASDQQIVGIRILSSTIEPWLSGPASKKSTS